MRFPFKLSILFLLASCAFATVSNGVVVASPSPAPAGTFIVSSTSSAPSDIGTMIFQPSISAGPPYGNDGHTCRIDYDAVNNFVYLHADAGNNTFAGYGYPGQTPLWGVMSNSQCSFSLPAFTVSRSGNTVSFTVRITFTPAYYGVLHLWTYGNSAGQENGSGWNYYTSWTAGAVAPPSVALTTPSNLSGSSATFGVTALDAAGASDILEVTIGIGWPPNGCIIAYAPSVNGVALLSDDGSQWLGVWTPAGSGAVLQNSTCIVPMSSVLGVVGGNYNQNLTFYPTFTGRSAGTQPIIAVAYNNAGAYTSGGWQSLGTFTVTQPQKIVTFSSLPGDTSPMVYDDYTGVTVQLPNSTGRIAEAYITQPTTTGQVPLAIGQSYTVVIAGAAPNTNVWARSTSESIPNASQGTYDSWSPASVVTVPTNGAGLVGSTDATGYFSATWTAAAIPGGTSTGFWVGGATAADPNYPAGVASSVDETTFCGQVWFYVNNPDGSTGTDFAPDAAKRIRLKGGKAISVARAPRVKVQKHPTSTFERDSAGVYTYRFSLDTRDASAKMIRVNDDLGLSLGPTFEDQDGNGWYALGEGWMAGDKAKRGSDVQFSLRSRWKPGPVEIFFHGDPAALPMQESAVENVRIARQTSMTRDSTTETAIGPAINPDISETELRMLVRSWKDVLGFSFLAPLLASSDFAAGIDLLKPSTEMERSIVQCLRDVN